jgi:DNA-binding transcriptional regulator YhcF (GntR family)
LLSYPELDNRGNHTVFSSPAQERAVRYLRQSIAVAHSGGFNKLPGIRKMAASAGVSVMSMWKAVHLLCAAKECFAEPCTGVLISSKSNETHLNNESMPTQVSVLQSLLKRLCDDIATGTIERAGTFPSIKEMCGRYGVCYQTMKKALAALERDGFLSRYKRTYRRHFAALPRRSAKIVLFDDTGSTRLSPASALSASRARLNRALERLAIDAGIGFEIHDYESGDNGGVLFDDKLGSQWPRINDNEVIGAIIRLSKTSNSAAARELSFWLAKKMIPIAVCDEGACISSAKCMKEQSIAAGYFILSSGIECGRDVGRFLAARGNNSIAYISPFHASCWSINRHEGLSEIYTNLTDNRMLKTSVKNLKPEDYQPGAQNVLLLKTADSVTDNLSFCREQGWLRSKMISVISDLIEKQAVYNTVTGLIDEVLSDSSITALVCCNDETAIMAQHYLLKIKGLQQRVAIVGFGNSFEADAENITSYEFNTLAMANKLFSFLRSPQYRRGIGKTNHVEGMIVERKSSDVRR